MASSTPKDITGQRFGRLVALSRIGKFPGGSKWLCRCDCGSERSVYLSHLTRGNTVSCGCYARHINTSHGLSGSAIHRRFHAMHQRCGNPNHKQFSDYGGRGIKVCPEWSDLASFSLWAFANGFEPELEIDRIDVNGDYSPDNCRFVDHRTNMNNRRNNRMVTVGGVARSIADTARTYGINHYTLRGRLNAGVAPEDAVKSSEEIYGKATRRIARIASGGLRSR